MDVRSSKQAKDLADKGRGGCYRIIILHASTILATALCYLALVLFISAPDIYSFARSITILFCIYPLDFLYILIELLLLYHINCCSTGDPALAVNSGGNGPVSAEWLIPKAMYLKENELNVYNSSRWIVECQDYLNYKLCGRMVASQNNAVTR